MRYHPLSHFGLKVVSIALAVGLWLMVARTDVVERGLRIPLELQNLPANLEMVEPPQEAVDVRVHGASDTLGRLAQGELVATIDLSSARTGRRLFHLSPDRVKAPFGVEVTQVTPATVAIRFEPSATRVVPVVPSVEGDPAPGFIVGEATAEPKTVEVVGPESALRDVSEAITEPVSVAAAKVQVRETVMVGVADSGVRLKSAKSALVTVAILPAPVERQLQNVPVRLRNLEPGMSARAVPSTVSVRVRGTQQSIARLRDGGVAAFVDLAGLGPGEYGLAVRLAPTSDVGIDQPQPAIVQIQVEQGPLR